MRKNAGSSMKLLGIAFSPPKSSRVLPRFEAPVSLKVIGNGPEDLFIQLLLSLFQGNGKALLLGSALIFCGENPGRGRWQYQRGRQIQGAE